MHEFGLLEGHRGPGQRPGGLIMDIVKGTMKECIEFDVIYHVLRCLRDYFDYGFCGFLGLGGCLVTFMSLKLMCVLGEF